MKWFLFEEPTVYSSFLMKYKCKHTQYVLVDDMEQKRMYVDAVCRFSFPILPINFLFFHFHVSVYSFSHRIARQKESKTKKTPDDDQCIR